MTQQADRIARMAEAKIEWLEARVATLEAELAARPPGPGKPVTIDADSAVPARNGGVGRVLTAAEAAADKQCRREREMRQAVKAAERQIEDQWHATFRERASLSFREHASSSFRELGITLWQAKAEARAAARKDVRARWAREDEELAAKVELPGHITRMPLPPR